MSGEICSIKMEATPLKVLEKDHGFQKKTFKVDKFVNQKIKILCNLNIKSLYVT